MPRAKDLWNNMQQREAFDEKQLELNKIVE